MLGTASGYAPVEGHDDPPYINLVAIFSPSYVIRNFPILLKFYFTQSIPLLWKGLLGAILLMNGLIQLRVHYPLWYERYCLLVMAALIGCTSCWFTYAIFFGGLRTLGSDTTKEVNQPGMVRAFSLDYWGAYCMAIALVFACGGAWIVLLSGSMPSLIYAVHCTLAGGHQSTIAGIAYILLGWWMGCLWAPAQMDWVDSGNGEAHRLKEGMVNKNIAFMTITICLSVLILIPEICSWFYIVKGMDLLWLQPIVVIVTFVFFCQIAFASGLFVGIATLMMPSDPAKFDEFGICPAVSSWWDELVVDPVGLIPGWFSDFVGVTMLAFAVYNALKIFAWCICPHAQDLFSPLITGACCGRNPRMVCTTPRWWRVPHALLGSTVQALVGFVCLGYLDCNSMGLPVACLVLALSTVPFGGHLFAKDGRVIPPLEAWFANGPALGLTIAMALLAFHVFPGSDTHMATRTFWMLTLAVNIAPLAEFPVLLTLVILPYGSDAFANLGLVKLIGVLIQAGEQSDQDESVQRITGVTYLHAVDEYLGIMTGAAWLISYLFNPGLLESNPLRDRLGYNNICVAWDAPPAQYIICVVAGLFAYLGLRYAWMSIIRTCASWKGLAPSVRFLSLTGDLVYAFGFCCFLMIFPLTPFISAFQHTLIFFTFITCRALFVLSRFVLDRATATTRGWIFCAIYTAVSIGGVINVFIGFTRYDVAFASGHKHLHPMLPLGTRITAFMDYLWIFMSVFTSRFLPTSCLTNAVEYVQADTSEHSPKGTTVGRAIA
eukprot:TRINITY_DN3178_c0_g1_i1.p1 TRINITY_DN3178_c0_g1~~TRINITY_DN3178_c0_g1_i1.p1  ORF type:complete len:774 (-),score=49.24 TRINITY_DN3178_c0_g1_i1:97-2418(-)